LTDQFYSY